MTLSYARGHIVDEKRGVEFGLGHIDKLESWRVSVDGYGVRVAHEVIGGCDGGQSQASKLYNAGSRIHEAM